MVTSSEETAARLCKDGSSPPARLAELCAVALLTHGLTAAERSDLLTEQGGALADLGRAADAEAAFRDAIKADRLSPSPHTGLGWLFWDYDRYTDAEAEFRASIALRPTAEALAGLGSAIYRGPNDGPEALEFIDAALAVEPDYRWAIREKGWILINRNRPTDAAAVFETAIAIEAEDWNAHFGLSRARADMTDYEGALQSVNTAIAIDPEPVWSYGHRAYVLRRLERNAQAVTEAETAIRLAPKWPNGHTQKALAQEALGQRGAAIGTFAAAIKSGVENAFMLYWYADVLSNDGQMTKAAKIIDRALTLPGSDQHDFSLKAYIAMKLEDYDGALAAAEQALEIDPDMPYPHYYAAVALINTGRLDDGVGRFDAAMELGLDQGMVGAFAADLIAAGKLIEAIRLRARY